MIEFWNILFDNKIQITAKLMYKISVVWVVYY